MAMLTHHYAMDNFVGVVFACGGSANAKGVGRYLLGEGELLEYIKPLGNLLCCAIQKKCGVVLEIGIVLVQGHVVVVEKVVVQVGGDCL